jgi:FtsH-binding integral membrane protein
MWTSNRIQIRLALLLGIAISVAMMSAKVLSYRSMLSMPSGSAYVFETLGLLMLYAFIVAWLTGNRGYLSGNALFISTIFGVIGSVVQIVHLSQEEFKDLGPVWDGVSGFGLLFVTFALWGIAAYRTVRRMGSLRSGAVAGAWSAIVTMSILILFGFAVEFYWAVPKPEYVVTWGEFKRSGWTDVHAFTIANTLDAAQSHLVIGPVIGAIVGGLAGLITRLQSREKTGAAVVH